MLPQIVSDMISHQALEVSVTDQLICSFICSLILSFIHLTEDLLQSRPMLGAGGIVVNETGAQ